MNSSFLNDIFGTLALGKARGDSRLFHELLLSQDMAGKYPSGQDAFLSMMGAEYDTSSPYHVYWEALTRTGQGTRIRERFATLSGNRKNSAVFALMGAFEKLLQEFPEPPEQEEQEEEEEPCEDGEEGLDTPDSTLGQDGDDDQDADGEQEPEDGEGEQDGDGEHDPEDGDGEHDPDNSGNGGNGDNDDEGHRSDTGDGDDDSDTGDEPQDDDQGDMDSDSPDSDPGEGLEDEGEGDGNSPGDSDDDGPVDDEQSDGPEPTQESGDDGHENGPGDTPDGFGDIDVPPEIEMAAAAAMEKFDDGVNQSELVLDIATSIGSTGNEISFIAKVTEQYEHLAVLAKMMGFAKDALGGAERDISANTGVMVDYTRGRLGKTTTMQERIALARGDTPAKLRMIRRNMVNLEVEQELPAGRGNLIILSDASVSTLDYCDIDGVAMTIREAIELFEISIAHTIVKDGRRCTSFMFNDTNRMTIEWGKGDPGEYLSPKIGPYDGTDVGDSLEMALKMAGPRGDILIITDGLCWTDGVCWTDDPTSTFYNRELAGKINKFKVGGGRIWSLIILDNPSALEYLTYCDGQFLARDLVGPDAQKAVRSIMKESSNGKRRKAL